MHRSLLVLKSVVFLLVAALGVAAQAADPTVSAPAGAPGISSPGTAYHYQVLPGNRLHSYSSVARSNVANRWVSGNATASDSFKETMNVNGDVIDTTSVTISARVPIDPSDDLNNIDVTSFGVGVFAGGYSTDNAPTAIGAGLASLSDFQVLNTLRGSATFYYMTSNGNTSNGNYFAKPIKYGTVKFNWNKRTMVLTVKVAQKVSAKVFLQLYDAGLAGETIEDYTGLDDGQFLDDANTVEIIFGSTDVVLSGTMKGTKKTATRANGSEVITGHARGRFLP